LKDKKLCIEAKKPFLILEKSLFGDGKENDPIEPENIGPPQRQKDAEASLCPSLRGDVDDVRTLHHRSRILVKEVYHFFRSFKGLPQEIFPRWLNHEDNVHAKPSPQKKGDFAYKGKDPYRSDTIQLSE
jgi:hypothetical protein